MTPESHIAVLELSTHLQLQLPGHRESGRQGFCQASSSGPHPKTIVGIWKMSQQVGVSSVSVPLKFIFFNIYNILSYSLQSDLKIQFP